VVRWLLIDFLREGGNMSAIHPRRRLQALAVSAAVSGVLAASGLAIPQVQPTDSQATSASHPATPAPAQPQPHVVQPPPTPEELGDTLMAHQRYQAALDAYKKGAHPSAQLWNKMGIAYQLLLDMEDAQRCYERSLRLDPKNAIVLNNLGTIYDSLKQYRDAEHMYRKALHYDAKSALIYKNLGTNLLSQHKYKKGWEYYKTAISLDSAIFQHNGSPHIENPASVEDRGAMNYYMAKGCLRAGMTDRAIEYLRMALNEGFTSPKKIMADSEFASLKGMPAFEQLLAEQQHTP
jgi:tetratricopeptide (TPR) repeat protein